MAVAVYGLILMPESFRPLSYYLAHMTRGDTNEKLMNKKTYRSFYVNQFLFQVHRHLVIQCYFNFFSLAIAIPARSAPSDGKSWRIQTRDRPALLHATSRRCFYPKGKRLWFLDKCWVITRKDKMFI